MTGPHGRPGRGAAPDTREIALLRQLRQDQPDLEAAVDLQIDLLQSQRRVRARIPLGFIDLGAGWVKDRLARGQSLLRLQDVPVEWSDVRLMIRQTADVLQRHQALEPDDYARAQRLARLGDELKPVLSEWFDRTAAAPAAQAPGAGPPPSEGLDQVLVLALRPFLSSCAEALLPQLDLSGWQRGYCPLCAGEPEFGTITPDGTRVLLCARCLGRWPFDPVSCPFCGNADRDRITSFASRDRLYRLFACNVCERYLKMLDERQASRGVSLAIDTIATLPLDAAAMQKGYRG